MKEKKVVAKETAIRYRRATKKKKSKILDEFVALTRYNRCYAAYLLRYYYRQIILPGTSTVFVCEKEDHRQKPKCYGEKVKSVLEYIWRLLDQPCGKRLAPYLSEIIAVLKRCGELDIDEETELKLKTISAATIDRILGPVKRKEAFKPKSHTKPGSLLKTQIAIRTFSEWDEACLRLS